MNVLTPFNSEPLSNIPLDLLFLHIVAPPTLHHFRPRKFVRKVTDFYWRWAARQLRLTSYMFGGEHPAETQFVSTKNWLSSFWRETATPAKLEFRGGYRRVPAEDNIALPKELRATVAVDKNGDPLDDAGRRLLERQNAEAEKARRVVSEDYTIVYLPPHFRYRVILFIVGLWLAFSVVLVSCIAAPIHVGRAFFKLVLNHEVHDAYSITIGFYLFWGCFFIGKTLDRMDKSRQRTAGDGPRGEWPVYVAKRALLWTAKFTWIAFWLGFVIPTLIGVIMEVYLVLPLRLMLVGDAPLRVRVFESWAVGLMYTKMALGTMRYRPETRIDAAITRVSVQLF
jgi:E3 ubiquitin-protein ligase MARCH6